MEDGTQNAPSGIRYPNLYGRLLVENFGQEWLVYDLRRHGSYRIAASLEFRRLR